MASLVLLQVVICSAFGSSLPLLAGSLPDHNKACSSGFGCALLNLSVGTVRGNVWSDGEEFLMIPYASAKRFEPPIPVSHFNNSFFDATNIDPYGKAACMQQPYVSGNDTYGVEECLIINIYRPKSNVNTNMYSHNNTSHNSSNSNSNNNLRPILLWIFGGDNTASEIIPYNATKLAGTHNAIVAVVSYRLNSFGFAAFEDDVKAGNSTGNNGIHDILTAAKFLQKEAVALGGDPNRIIAFGESSGATDSQILSMVPAAQGVISGSISESGGLYAQSLEVAVNNTIQVAKGAGCDGIVESFKTCLQKKTAAQVVASSGDFDWGPTVDGVLLTMQPAELLAAGLVNPNVSVLWGGNTNDSATPFQLYTYLSEKAYIQQLNDTVHGYQPPGMLADAPRRKISGHRHHARVLKAAALRRQQLHQQPSTSASKSASHTGSLIGDSTTNTSDLLQRALELYPPRRFGEPKHPLGNNADLVGWFDSDRFLCNIRREALGASKAVSGRGKAYAYRFDWLFQSYPSCVADSNYHNPKSGSNHCDEMSFVMGQPIFDNQDPPGYSFTNCSDPASKYYDEKRCVGCVFNATEQAFSSQMGEFWTQFARTGNPSNTNAWPAFTVDEPVNIALHPNNIAVERDMGRTAACELWDDVERQSPNPH